MRVFRAAAAGRWAPPLRELLPDGPAAERCWRRAGRVRLPPVLSRWRQCPVSGGDQALPIRASSIRHFTAKTFRLDGTRFGSAGCSANRAKKLQQSWRYQTGKREKICSSRSLTVFLNAPDTAPQLTGSAPLAAEQAALLSFVNEKGSVFWGGNGPLGDTRPRIGSECLSSRKEFAEEACPLLKVDATILWPCCVVFTHLPDVAG